MWTPVFPSLLEHVYQLVLSDMFAHTTPNVSRNLTSGQYKALDSLKNNSKIIIKPADKGSNVVILNKKDYIQEGLRQLHNTDFYAPQPSDLTSDFHDEVQSYVQKMYDEGEIDKKCYKYLSQPGLKTPNFYMLPKIHKSLEQPPGRPIVASIDSPTEKISHLDDTILRTLVTLTQSFVKDTGHMLQILSDFMQQVGTLPDNCFLVVLDAVSLYTNIPHLQGKQAVARALQRYRPGNVNPSNQSIIKMLDLVLTKNNFNFGDKQFLQISGTAMGTRLAPNYANLFMDDFEQRHVYTYKIPPLLWKRFIDDIFCIFQGTEQELLEFIEFLNSKSPPKFTYEYSRHSVNFLDTTIYVENRKIQTTLFVKETDSHSYLAFDSCHPKHNITSIPYSQLLRVKRICSTWTEFFRHSFSLILHFSLRGYPMDLLTDALLKANQKNIEDVVNTDNSTQTDDDVQQKTLYFIQPYNPSSPPMKDIITKHWPILGRSNAS